MKKYSIGLGLGQNVVTPIPPIFPQNRSDCVNLREPRCTDAILDLMEAERVENWCGLKIGQVLFDSTTDDWSINKSVFASKLYGISNLLYIITDGTGNKFGAFVSKPFHQQSAWVRDEDAFIFMLKYKLSQGLKPIEITMNGHEHAFYVFGNDEDELCAFAFGEILVYKKDFRNKSCCIPDYTDNPPYVLLPTDRVFYAYRICVVKMI
ncbi:hypothetical protein EIN_173650 [Entamoeba invadens IP1]|uniref:TLDc domain-containing protein n=1 Tax=Entamoeba invadens IP1 TaxID=370355 RepID=A0A0A1TYP7_ENTIV|nr:hypothetical protein EIN_173650 [Entamoeba invadens IP1]ELP84690.1 hypothetical protein EIN_173650 [Entamoeba invadens IP1]|eukprot:XP_004184036.1 hypothetical protein EIN_173650 [Entamoeba invadens IP1]